MKKSLFEELEIFKLTDELQLVPSMILSSTPIIDHHNKTRPPGGVGGHTVFDIRIIETGEHVKIEKRDAWFISKE